MGRAVGGPGARISSVPGSRRSQRHGGVPEAIRGMLWTEERRQSCRTRPEDPITARRRPGARHRDARRLGKKLTGKVVPTWNYVAVHAQGQLAFFEDDERLLDLVTRLAQVHEDRRGDPWFVTDAPTDYIRDHLEGIVGFGLVISKLDGSWKVSQNRPAENRAADHPVQHRLEGE